MSIAHDGEDICLAAKDADGMVMVIPPDDKTPDWCPLEQQHKQRKHYMTIPYTDEEICKSLMKELLQLTAEEWKLISNTQTKGT